MTNINNSRASSITVNTATLNITLKTFSFVHNKTKIDGRVHEIFL